MADDPFVANPAAVGIGLRRLVLADLHTIGRCGDVCNRTERSVTMLVAVFPVKLSHARLRRAADKGPVKVWSSL